MILKKLPVICFLLLHFSFSLFSQRNLLTNELKRVSVASLISAPAFHQFPLYNEREQWENIPKAYRDAYVKKADQYIGFDWPLLSASLFLEYSKTGDRSRFEKVAENRREVLGTLVIAECIQHKGKYLNDILNGVWAICEQSYWGVPAHLSLQKKKFGLPDVSEPTVDLFAAETAALIAWTYYFLGEQLDSISSAVGERIIYETDRRILSPNLARTDFWWMGFDSHTVNNWNPWIVSNWLTCVMILEKDDKKKEAAIRKIAACLDNFLNPYPGDGGCDEGPTYWNRAGGSLYDCLEILYQASNKSFDIFQNPLVKSIGTYIYKANIADAYYINFADASAKTDIDPSIVYGYGERIANDTLKHLASKAFKDKSSKDYDNNGSLYRQLLMIFNLKNLESFNIPAERAAVYWLPESQVLTARSENNSSKGLFLGAHGGHNAESHNHNDVGNFIVYFNGKPALIDVGVESYTAKTFSDKRYEIWTMQSAYHNCPTVNGIMQSPGLEFAAKNVEFSSAGKNVSLMMNIESSYPPEADIQKWKRSWTFNRGKSITLTDDYKLNSIKGDTYFTLMSSNPIELEPQKMIVLGDGFKINIAFDKNQLSPEVEPIVITDPRLKYSWGEKIYRIKLHLKNPGLSGKVKLNITGENNN
jgi:hypothetical protein